MTKRQQKALQTVWWFRGEVGDDGRSDALVKLTGVEENENGVEPQLAFFDITERGKYPQKVKDKSLLRKLLWAQRRMALNIAMWKEGKEEGLCFLWDFEDEPDYIQELVKKTVFI